MTEQKRQYIKGWNTLIDDIQDGTRLKISDIIHPGNSHAELEQIRFDMNYLDRNNLRDWESRGMYECWMTAIKLGTMPPKKGLPK